MHNNTFLTKTKTTNYIFPTISNGGIPLIFSNCSDYEYPNDNKYATCDLSSKEDPCEYLKYLHVAKNFRPYFLGLIPLIFSIIALLVNSIFVFISILLLRKNNEKAEIRYTFLLSRSISTIIAQIMFYIVLISWKSEEFEYYLAAIFLTLASLSFLTLAGTYVALSIIIYIAVAKSEWYEDNITIKNCTAINIINWTITVTLSVFVGIYGATLFYPDSSPITCGFHACQEPLAITLIILTIICYFTVLAVYIFALLRIKRKSHQLIKLVRKNSIKRNIKFMNRMSYNLIMFAMSKLPLLIVCIIGLANLENLKTLGNGKKSSCKTFLNGKLYFQAELFASIAGFIWLIGMILDPIINSISDYRMIQSRLLKKPAKKVTSRISK